MKIINLKAENFKRLQAVEISPDGNMVILSGANEQGKSSVLDAIWYALAGGKASKDIPEPIRRGEGRAEVTLDMGDICVRRVWEPDKNRVEVTNADGQKYSSPQAILDALTGSLTFDPLEFARMAPRDQRATLLGLIDLPFNLADNDRERAAKVTEETNARRDVKLMEGAVANLPNVPDGTPDAEIPAADILAEIQAREAVINANTAKRQELKDARADYAWREKIVKETEKKVEMIREQLNRALIELELDNKRLDELRETGTKLAAEVASLVDPDMSELDAKFAAIDSTNAAVRQKQENADKRRCLKNLRAAAEKAAAAIKAHDKARAEALAAAKFPVDGLGFSDDGVTLDGLPFEQASESQRIKTSVAMGMAANTKLHVMLVRDGSSLDSKRMAEVAEMAKGKDYQLWVEKVDESGAVGVVIEDGRVKGGAAE